MLKVIKNLNKMFETNALFSYSAYVSGINNFCATLFLIKVNNVYLKDIVYAKIISQLGERLKYGNALNYPEKVLNLSMDLSLVFVKTLIQNTYSNTLLTGIKSAA